MSYAKYNLFVGVYDVPENGHISLPDTCTIKFLRGKITEEGWRQTNHPNDAMWLIVEDKDFWPVMINLGGSQ